MRKVDALIRKRAAGLIERRPGMPNAVAIVNAAFYLGRCFDRYAPEIVYGIEREAREVERCRASR